MAKLCFLITILLVGQALCQQGIDDDHNEQDLQECKDNEAYNCAGKPCNPMDEEEREETLRNCPVKCKTCPGDQCKDTRPILCSRYAEACDESIPMYKKSDAMRSFASTQFMREMMWQKCRKTCNYPCPKMPAPEKICASGDCCWSDKAMPKGPFCPECRDMISANICRMFRTQCTCIKGATCNNSGRKFQKLCPATCGLCNPKVDYQSIDDSAAVFHLE